LFYSVVARRDQLMRYPSYKGILREGFGSEHKVAALEFPSHLGFLMQQLSAGHPCARFDGLERLTLLPWYSPFLPPDRSAHIREAMLGSGGRECWNRAGISASRIKTLSYLRYCPECLRADQAVGRTLYWRRLHQLAGIEVCPIHQVWLENSAVQTLKRDYRFLLPTADLLDVSARVVDETNAGLIGLAKLGSQLLAQEWPVMATAQLRQNYLVLLERAGYVNSRGQVKMDALLREVCRFYQRGFLGRLGCRKHYWLGNLVRSRASIQQPIRHLMLLNFLGVGLDELFVPKRLPTPAPVEHANLPCVNFLCREYGHSTSVFLKSERMSEMGGDVEAYRCDACGQVQGRCCVGHTRTWVRDLGPLWRERLAELWADPAMSLRAIAKSLRVSCDAVRKHALKLGLPLARPGRRPMSVKAYPHLVTPKATKRQRKVEAARKRWLATKVRLPDLGMRGLREKLPAEYMVLWRYDREWLEANLPPRRKRRQSVDWGRRDKIMCHRLEVAASRLPGAAPTKLAKVAGVNGWLHDRLSKLPQARKTLERLAGLSRN
jgi:hypothetical protein